MSDEWIWTLGWFKRVGPPFSGSAKLTQLEGLISGPTPPLRLADACAGSVAVTHTRPLTPFGVDCHTT